MDVFVNLEGRTSPLSCLKEILVKENPNQGCCIRLCSFDTAQRCLDKEASGSINQPASGITGVTFIVQGLLSLCHSSLAC